MLTMFFFLIVQRYFTVYSYVYSFFNLLNQETDCLKSIDSELSHFSISVFSVFFSLSSMFFKCAPKTFALKMVSWINFICDLRISLRKSLQTFAKLIEKLLRTFYVLLKKNTIYESERKKLKRFDFVSHRRKTRNEQKIIKWKHRISIFLVPYFGTEKTKDEKWIIQFIKVNNERIFFKSAKLEKNYEIWKRHFWKWN